MTTFVDANGKLLLTIHANAEIVALNAPEGGIAVIDPPSSQGYYYCHTDCEWRSIPEQPSRWHSFDCASRTWVDVKTLDDAKMEKWTSIKEERDEIEFGGFEFVGSVYDSDAISQNRIIAAAQLGAPAVWTLKDNSSIELTAQQLKELSQSLASHITLLHERARIARQLICDAVTIEEIESIVF
ncbi:MAG: DUF4376 domain-containing protein [Acinetobacter sp.]|nr:DUF4376 domain-containing protein [Acinetobacter sp.]